MHTVLLLTTILLGQQAIADDNSVTCKIASSAEGAAKKREIDLTAEGAIGRIEFTKSLFEGPAQVMVTAGDGRAPIFVDFNASDLTSLTLASGGTARTPVAGMTEFLADEIRARGITGSVFLVVGDNLETDPSIATQLWCRARL